MKITVAVLDFDPAANFNRCIESILQQTYQNMEILLMSQRMPEAQDSRIVHCTEYIHELADIDTAIRQSTGEYICFVETSCCLSPLFVETMAKMCTESMADMVSCGIMAADRNTPLEQIGVPLRLYHPTAVDRYTFIGMLENDKDNIFGFFENKMYSTSLMKAILPVTGDDKLDKGIVWHIAHSCNTVTVTEQPLFFYTGI